MEKTLEAIKNTIKEGDWGPCALMRWNYGNNRVAETFVPASDIRLTCARIDEKGDVALSMSAPYGKKQLGCMRLRLADKDIVLLTSGSRKGMNCLLRDVRDNEMFSPLTNIRRCLDESELTERDIAQLGSMVYTRSLVSVSQVTIPKFYVMTRRPATLEPLWSRSLYDLLGIDRESDSPETAKQKFVAGIDKISERTQTGYLIDPKYVASGGMLCISCHGAERQTGGPVYMVPLDIFDYHSQANLWHIFDHCG